MTDLDRVEEAELFLAGPLQPLPLALDILPALLNKLEHGRVPRLHDTSRPAHYSNAYTVALTAVMMFL